MSEADGVRVPASDEVAGAVGGCLCTAGDGGCTAGDGVRSAGGGFCSAGEEFSAAAMRCLGRFESRWPVELEQGLQELDARYEQIVAALEVFFTPQGVMPNLPLPASMAEVFLDQVKEVVLHIQSREAALIEELRSGLEGELSRYIQRTEQMRWDAPASSSAPMGAAATAASSATAATGAADAAAGSVLLQFHSWALVALAAPVHADNLVEMVEQFADDCFELLCSALPIRLAFLVKLIRKVWRWGKMPFKVLKRLSPHRVLLWVLKKLASPARRLLLAALPLVVRQAMGRFRDRLKGEFDGHAAAMVHESRVFIENARRNVERTMPPQLPE